MTTPTTSKRSTTSSLSDAGYKVGPTNLSHTAPTSSPVGKKILGVEFKDEAEQARILSTVQEWYSRCKNARATVERQWYINMAFYAGRQYIRMVPTPGVGNGFKLDVPKAPPWRVRLVINRTRMYIRSELAKVTSQRPTFYVVPATTEDEDLISARVAEQIFDSVYTNYDLKRTIRQAEWWNCVCGNSFIKTAWDKNAEFVSGNKTQQGDLSYQVFTPFHIYVPELQEPDIQKQPYVIQATTQSVDWVKQTFPELKNINTDVNQEGDILDSGFLNIIGAKNVVRNQVLVLEVWMKKGKQSLLPDGGMVTIIGGQVAQKVDGMPYNHKEYPYQKLNNVETGRFYSTSSIEDIIPLQRELNRTRSQIIEAKNMMSKPKLLAASGSIEAKQITAEPGQTIYYKMGYPAPTPMPLPSLPAYVLEEVNQLMADMDDLVGQHQISRGGVPGQMRAASALQFVKEQDDTVLSGLIENLEEVLESMGKQTLALFVQYVNQERMIRTVGDDMVFDAQLFEGSFIKGNTDIRVESGSALPQSKAAKQAFVMDLLKMGFIPPEQGLDMLDIGGIEKIYESYLVDKRQATRENQKMMMSLVVEPNDFDNHQVHLDIHNKFRKSQQYEALDEETKTLFQTHVAGHVQAMQSGLQPGGQFPPPQQSGPTGELHPINQPGQFPPRPPSPGIDPLLGDTGSFTGGM